MSGILLPAGCCCDVATPSEDCEDCSSSCNDLGSISWSIDYTQTCGAGGDCDGKTGGSGTLVKAGTCFWSSDGGGGVPGGDFELWIYCNDDLHWAVDVYSFNGATACRSLGTVVEVVCVSGRPTGVFNVTVYDETLAAECGTATITLSIPV